MSIHATAAGTPAHEVVVYFEVQDVDATVAAVEARGLGFESQPVDQSWLWREAYIRDPAGNLLCIFHAGENRRYPPWRIDTDPE